MSLPDEMKADFEKIEKLARQAETQVKNGQLEKAEETIEEIKDLSDAWL